MKKFLILLTALAVSLSLYTGCSDDMSDLGGSTATGTELDMDTVNSTIAAIQTAAAKGNYELPNALYKWDTDTDPSKLMFDGDDLMYVDSDGDDLTGYYKDEAGEYFNVASQSLLAQYGTSDGDFSYYWNSTDNKYERAYTDSTLTWFGIANPNFEKKSDEEVYNHSYSYTAKIKFSEVGQSAYFIIGFATPNGDIAGGVGAAITCTGDTANGGELAVLVPDPIANEDTATGNAYAVANTPLADQAAYLTAGETNKFLKEETLPGQSDSSYFYVYPVQNAGDYAVIDKDKEYTIVLTVSGGDDTTPPTAKITLDGTEKISFAAFGSPWDANQAGTWLASWKAYVANTTKQAGFLAMINLGSTTSKSPAISLLKSGE